MIPQLRMHPNGQWYVPLRMHGVRKNHYFGKVEADAREQYLRQLPDLMAGRQPVGNDPSRVTVLELTDRFIIAQEERFRANDIGIREFDDLRRAALLFREWAGPHTLCERMTVPSPTGSDDTGDTNDSMTLDKVSQVLAERAALPQGG